MLKQFQLEDVARKYHVMAALPNIDVEKTARRSQQQQLQGRRSIYLYELYEWQLWTVRKRCDRPSRMHLQPRFQITRVQSRTTATRFRLKM